MMPLTYSHTLLQVAVGWSPLVLYMCWFFVGNRILEKNILFWYSSINFFFCFFGNNTSKCPMGLVLIIIYLFEHLTFSFVYDKLINNPPCDIISNYAYVINTSVQV